MIRRELVAGAASVPGKDYKSVGPWLGLMFAWLAVSLALASCASTQGEPAETIDHEPRPNFLVIVADDMGYSDMGAYGGEIDTPNLDRLAARGVRFTDFHVSPSCSPTRAMLLTGNDSHVAGLGGMAEALRPRQRGQPGYEGHLNDHVLTIAERLRGAGYFTAMTGKWHLGAGPGQIPWSRGFDRSFALMNGAANYFGKDQGGLLSGTLFGATYYEDGTPARLPDGEYTTNYFTTRLIEFLEQNKKAGGKPFFAYLAFNAPHTPLQAPAEAIAKYDERYDAGPRGLRAERLEGLVKKGLIANGTRPAAMLDAPSWQDLPASMRTASARRMEVYAAAVDVLDVNVGRILDGLERSGDLANTIVIFLSDNGAEGNDEDVWLDFLGKLGMPQQVLTNLRAANHDLARAGSSESYLAYGHAWAQAGMAPYSLTKGYVSEGGIRAPMVIAGPGIPKDRIDRNFVHVMDIAPTILQLAGLGVEQRDGVRDPQGRSLLPVIANFSDASERPTGWELFGRQAIRSGPWKAVYQNRPILSAGAGAGRPHWALYDLDADPGETRDLAKARPAKLASLLEKWEVYARTNGVIAVPQIGDPASGARRPGGQ